MRPRQLSMEGFGAFRERTTVDFDGLELFAIAGPTGAGKSTLLDAITFALYGRVPRVGVQVGELISLGLERAQVTLEFTAAGRRFLVTRSLRRGKGKSAEAMLEELGQGAPRPSSGVKDVNARIQAVLGLNYDAFTQAVLLPQGEFARFMKSPPGERRAILRELLRLNVYERMRELANERRAALGAEATALRDRLAQDYAHATLDTVKDAVAALAAAVEKRSALEAQLTALRAEVERARAQQELATLLEQLRAQKAALDAQQADVDGQARTLEVHGRAEPMRAMLEQLAQATAAQQGAQLAHTAAQATLEEATQQHARALQALQEAQRGEQELPRLQERQRQLEEAAGDWRALHGLQQQLQSARDVRDNAAVRLAQAQQAHQDLTAQATAAQSESARCEKELQRLEVPTVPEAELTGLRAALERATSLAGQLERTRAAHADVVARLKESQARLDAVAAQQAEADNDEKAAQQEETQAQARVDEARAQHAAVHLRKALVAGEPCPVCGQDVEKVPRAPRAPALASLETALEKAHKAAQKAQKKAAQVQALYAAAHSAVTELSRVVSERVEEEQALQRALDGVAGPLRARWAQAPWLEMARRLEDAVALHARRQEAQRTWEGAQRATQLAHATRDATALSLQGAREEHARAQEQFNAAEVKTRAVQARLAELGSVEDPQQQRAAVAAAMDAIRVTLLRARETAEAAGAALERARTGHGDSAGRVRESTAALEQASRAAQAASTKAGFVSPQEAHAALLPAGTASAMASRVASHRTQYAAVSSQLENVLGRVGDVPSQPLSQLEQQRATLEDALRQAHQAEATAVAQEKHMRTLVEQGAALRTRLDAASKALALHETLAQDLRSDRFQAFLLQETFSQLLEGASRKLWELTGRYTLELREEQFMVVDHDHARERRSADTLSGGETFLASLALALELSDHVQRLAGATALDSLFIDEGFGTLDNEALDVAASAVEGLPVGGRMVGIVTHVQALTDRLPARLQVEKSSQGAKVLRISGA